MTDLEKFLVVFSLVTGSIGVLAAMQTLSVRAADANKLKKQQEAWAKEWI